MTTRRAKGTASAAVSPFSQARRHLSRRDAVMKRVIAQVGPCTLEPGGDPFGALVRAVVAQMISTKAARAISNRLAQCLGEITPARVLAAGAECLRAQGLSRAKALS